MLTDSVSQFETKGVNDIPKSFRKLISEIQNVKKFKQQSKNPPLNIKTIQKNTKKPTTVKKNKRNLKKANPPKNAINLEIDSDEELLNFTKNSLQTLNQTNITEYFNTVKRTSPNYKNFEESKKQEVPNVHEEVIFSDDDNLLYSNQNVTADIENENLPASEFQNPDYLKFLSSRNSDFITTNDLQNDFVYTENGLLRDENQTTGNENWKTFNEINTDADGDFDFDIERKKNIAPSILYSHNKSTSKTPFKSGKAINKSGPIVKKNQNVGPITNKRREKETSNNLLIMLKGDQEKIEDLLNEVKSMHDVISKTTQDISKFFGNRNT